MVHLSLIRMDSEGYSEFNLKNFKTQKHAERFFFLVLNIWNGLVKQQVGAVFVATRWVGGSNPTRGEIADSHNSKLFG